MTKQNGANIDMYALNHAKRVEKLKTLQNIMKSLQSNSKF